MTKTHAGSIVEKAIRRHHLSISTISRKMTVDRRTIYNWFKKEDLSSKIIGRIGQVLDYDFSEDFQNMTVPRDISTYKEPVSIMEPEYPLTGSSQYWMLKYIELLEKYNALSESMSSAKIVELNKLD
jgi:plasmid maintenance system antidote protein VapI